MSFTQYDSVAEHNYFSEIPIIPEPEFDLTEEEYFESDPLDFEPEPEDLDDPEPKPENKPYRTNTQFIATDAEWDTSLPDPWICQSFFDGYTSVLFVRSDVPEDVKQRMRIAAKNTEPETDIVFIERGDDVNLVSMLPASMTDNPDVVLLNYYSPKDLEYAFGWSMWKEAIEAGSVRQGNSLVGKVENIALRDLSGWAGKTSLAKFAEALGIDNTIKGSMDEFKSCMWRGLLERPELFVEYAVYDSLVLCTINVKFITMIREIQTEYLGMSGKQLWGRRIPTTAGSLTANTFLMWLKSKGIEDEVKMLGVRAVADGKPLDIHDRKKLKQTAMIYDAISAGGVRRWGYEKPDTTLPLNAIVNGGRCVNEWASEYVMGEGADIDLASCYGSVLRSSIFPVGIPTVGYVTNNQGALSTLGEWIDKHGSNLVPGLWQVVVEGELPFRQDLIFSTNIDAAAITRAVLADKKLDKDFALLRKEIRNGVITHDVWRVIENVATKQEKSQFRNLRVRTWAAYLAGDRVDDVQEWKSNIAENPGEYVCEEGNVSDRRNRAWLAVPLEDYIGRLVDERNRLKHEGRTDIANVLKLLINTLFGDFASGYFDCGNSIVANNITASARVGVWQMAKALGTRQSITDGGAYDYRSVADWREKKPGFAALATMSEWASGRYRFWKPLEGLAENPDCRTLDRLAAEHIRDFWGRYGIDFVFNVEHKTTFTRFAWLNKGDYAYLPEDGAEPKIAVRGKEKRQRVNRHPIMPLFENILAGSDNFPTDMQFDHHSIMKIGKYLQVQESSGFEHLKTLRPGDSTQEERLARFGNAHLPADTWAEYESRANRKRVQRGEPVEHYERCRERGIAHVHRMMFTSPDRLPSVNNTRP